MSADTAAVRELAEVTSSPSLSLGHRGLPPGKTRLALQTPPSWTCSLRTRWPGGRKGLWSRENL